MNYFNQPSDVSPATRLYSQIAEKSALLLQLAQQERWEEFPSAESELNHLVCQLEKFDTDEASLSEADRLLHTVYIRQIMLDNEKTSLLVKERTSYLENALKVSARKQKLDEGYGLTGPMAGEGGA
jgi:hypothetical protein